MNEIDSLSVSCIRLLAADAIEKAKSGHPGMPIGAAPIAYALWRRMRHNPKNPKWRGRDRFVLSAGHASMLEYAMLNLYGYGVSLDDIKQFRQFGSITPGHPEYGITPGVEASTGPLGQGFAMAVGMAMARAHLAGRFNRDGFPIVNNKTYVLMGDGCMMEGVASEAASLAGALNLKGLIAIYDCNKITIEGSTELAFTENVAGRFTAYGWQVISVDDGNDIDAIDRALAVAELQDRPVLIIVRTKIAYGTPKEGKSSAHGEPLGPENIGIAREIYGWPYSEPFTVPDEVKEHFNALAAKGGEDEARYNAMIEDYRARYPELYDEWERIHDSAIPEELLNDPELWNFTGDVATRAASGKVLNILCKHLPNLIGGSADLGPSNKTELKGVDYMSESNMAGRNIHFGIREFAMAAACNGIALYGGLRVFCATFLVFSDYLKPALRLSALMGLPVIYVFTHDSIGVGEDGPTHQPIEHLAMFRSMPNTRLFRPADGKETAAAYISALQFNGPTVIALSRQNLKTLEATGTGAMRGGYVVKRAKGKPDVLIMATGSELSPVIEASEILEKQGYDVQLVSMPCMELFDEQDDAYKQSVIPNETRARIAVEAASPFGWHKYVGIDGRVIGMNSFGASAPSGKLFEHFGFTVDRITNAALELLKGI